MTKYELIGLFPIHLKCYDHGKESWLYLPCYSYSSPIVLQASLSITSSQSLLKLMSLESVILSNHLTLCCLSMGSQRVRHDWVTFTHSAYKLNKQGDNIQPCILFPIWNQSIIPCPVLTVASWLAYRFLRGQVRWSGVPISLKTFQSSTQSKGLV